MDTGRSHQVPHVVELVILGIIKRLGLVLESPGTVCAVPDEDGCMQITVIPLGFGHNVEHFIHLSVDRFVTGLRIDNGQ